MKKKSQEGAKKKKGGQKRILKKKSANGEETKEDKTTVDKNNKKTVCDTIELDDSGGKQKSNPKNSSLVKKADEDKKKQPQSGNESKRGTKGGSKRSKNSKLELVRRKPSALQKSGEKKSKKRERKIKKDELPTAEETKVPSDRKPPQGSNRSDVPIVEEPQPEPPSDAAKRWKGGKEWATAVLERGADGIVADYKSIANQEIPPEKYKVFTENADKNRYDNTYCFDHSRVKLGNGDGPDSYINANYLGVAEYRPKQFICTQGPLDTTVDSFWQMVFDEGCEMIVMLCDLIEKGQEKCFKYWPSDLKEKRAYGAISVTNNGSLELDAAKPVQIVITLFQLTNGDKSATVRHFHWRSWPDHGAPTSFHAPFKLHQHIKGTSKPVVTHCSAGVGRTGTMALISLAMEHLLKEGNQGLLELLTKMREQRANLVQNEIQYLYAHRCLLEYFSGKEVINKEALEKFNKEYDTYMVTVKAKRKRKKDATKEMEG